MYGDAVARMHGDLPQGAAMAVGQDEIKMPEVDGALILHLQKTQWKLLPVDTSPDAFNAFLSALDTATWKLTGEKEAVGSVILKGRG